MVKKRAFGTNFGAGEPEGINTPDTGNAGNGADESRGDNESIVEPEIIAGYETIDPAGINTGGDSEPRRNKDGSIRKRRGPNKRTAGSTAQTPNNKASVERIEMLLLSIHLMGANILKTPELVLDSREAHQLAEATAEVARFYDAILDEKTMAWLNLAAVAGAIYGTRFFVISQRTKKPRIVDASQRAQTAQQATPRPNGAPVVPIVKAEAATPRDLYGPVGYTGEDSDNDL